MTAVPLTEWRRKLALDIAQAFPLVPAPRVQEPRANTAKALEESEAAAIAQNLGFA
jgi:hypothetical protein